MSRPPHEAQEGLGDRQEQGEFQNAEAERMSNAGSTARFIRVGATVP
jgi:hypothetical protein